MSKAANKSPRSAKSASTAKYDAHHGVLNKTYGALADLRRELSDSKASIAERTELLQLFGNCADSQRAWLLLEDYFEKLSLSRKDFSNTEWWVRLMEAKGRARLEETALLFLRTNRPLPTELIPYANFERFAAIEQAEQETKAAQAIEAWLMPPTPTHLDAPRAYVQAVCEVEPSQAAPHLHQLAVRLVLSRPRSGEKQRSIGEIVDLNNRSAHEQELFSSADWAFIQWLGEIYPANDKRDRLTLSGRELLEWLARWGQSDRLEVSGATSPLSFSFQGAIARWTQNLSSKEGDLWLTHLLELSDGSQVSQSEVQLFTGSPALVLKEHTFYLLSSVPPSTLLEYWNQSPSISVKRLSHRLITHLRKNKSSQNGGWDQLCTVRSAVPQFLFELNDDTVHLRLMARDEKQTSLWQWNGHEWQKTEGAPATDGKPEILEDPKLEAATLWLRRLDWFTPEPGLWVGDANESFLNSLAVAWPDKPDEALYLGNPAFQRLFLAPRQLKPKLVVQGSGIDWLSVSAEWEQEGMKLTPADLARLQTATGRFVKLPDSGWIELDRNAVREARETLADLGLELLSNDPKKVSMLHASQMNEDSLNRFANKSQLTQLRQRLKNFSGIIGTSIPSCVQAELRPYQKEGFDFLCHLHRLKLGGVLADDMGLGKTLQTLAWLAWLRETSAPNQKPALVICPASVLHNWRREANRFTPHLKVLVLESGSARHNLRKQIPQHDIIVTNYALLRRDLEALQKFSFLAVVLDEAQFIKNPEAQITQSVKQLNADQRLALTGTPLENRLLDLWSIVDFVEPGYLGTQAGFNEKYDPKGADAEFNQRIARRSLASKLRPILTRRLKQQVAKDLPDRIEQRRDCDLGEDQRKLYLAELRRSREQVMKAVAEKGIQRSKLHVLAALTRLRQICCHPKLVGSDSASGKTETLFELLEPLIAEGQKVLLFSQFVQMLTLLENECKARQIPTHVLTGETKNRQEIVNNFQNDPNASVFLLSLRAAGTGLNLTTASYVILYDPWWNPAVEAQAIDRSHRIGQTQTVNAYRLIAPGTVEEKIWELQQRKAQTISDVLGEEGFARNLTSTDLEYLFSED